MAPMRPGAAPSLVPGAPLLCASSGFAGAAANRRQPTKGSGAPATSRRNRERDRAVLRKSCDMGTSGVRSSGLQDASARRVAVEPTADIRDRILVEASVEAAGDVADMRCCQQVRQRAERTVKRQRLLVKDI